MALHVSPGLYPAMTTPLLGSLGANIPARGLAPRRKSCPAPLPSAGKKGGKPDAFIQPYKPKYRRYQDKSLQEVYTHIVASLREKKFPIYGHVFSHEEADRMARNAVDAVRRLPQSQELQERARCMLEPMVEAAAAGAVGKLLLGTFTFGLLGVAGMTGWRLIRQSR